ncbi:MAG TPA: hypothetical protein VIV14_06680 [Gammaproteobacteria bacterium]
MDRSKVADISQIVSSAAILFTLIYLAVEVSQNTAALNAQSRETVLSISQASLFAALDNPEIIESFVKPETLTPHEKIRLNSFLVAFLRGREFAWLQYRDGIIDDGQWNTELAALRFVMLPTRNRDWWERFGRLNFSPEFAAFVDTEFAGTPPTDELWQGLLDWEN